MSKTFMSTPHQYLEELLERKITLSQPQITQGASSHNHIRSLLKNKKDTDARFPWLLDEDFLSGSYARGTKIYPLDDIDVMVVLDGTGLFLIPNIQNGQVANVTVRGSGEHGSPVLSLTDFRGHISSRRVLETFRDAIKSSYPNSTIRKDGQAVNVWLEAYGLGLDIVPCFRIVPHDGSKERYYIPIGKDSDFWMPTNPKMDRDICDTLDDLHDKKLKPVIRLLRYWNTVHNRGALKPYHLEVLTWRVFAQGHQLGFKITDYASALRYFFNNVHIHLNASCPDPTGIGGHIDAYLPLLTKLQVLTKINEVKQTLTQNVLQPLLGIAPPPLTGLKKIFSDS